MAEFTSRAAQECVAAVVETAAAHNLAVSVAIVDGAGYLITLVRMDGAGFLTPQIAEAKAFTAAAWGKPTSVVAERARQIPETFQAFIGIGRTKVVPGLGGRPLQIQGKTVGAIGVSGASADEDELLAALGLRQFRRIGRRQSL
jgi:glc operon protein GlcG